MKCVICLDSLGGQGTVVSTPCGHLYHLQCLAESVTGDGQRTPRDDTAIHACSICRAPFIHEWDEFGSGLRKVYIDAELSSSGSQPVRGTGALASRAVETAETCLDSALAELAKVENERDAARTKLREAEDERDAALAELAVARNGREHNISWTPYMYEPSQYHPDFYLDEP